MDLFFTGEMSHHEVLAALGKGTSVITVGHWNSEHGYLEKMRTKLQEILNDDGYQVFISQTDSSPFKTV